MVTIKKKPSDRQPTFEDFPVVDILARVIWGEAEGEGAEGQTEDKDKKEDYKEGKKEDKKEETTEDKSK